MVCIACASSVLKYFDPAVYPVRLCMCWHVLWYHCEPCVRLRQRESFVADLTSLIAVRRTIATLRLSVRSILGEVMAPVYLLSRYVFFLIYARGALSSSGWLCSPTPDRGTSARAVQHPSHSNHAYPIQRSLCKTTSSPSNKPSRI